MTSAQELRYAAIAEAVTLVVLICIAVPLKHLAGMPQLVSVMGPVHGAIFLLFLWVLVRSWAEGLIDGIGATRLFVGAMIPFGGFVNERWLRRQTAGEAS